MKGKAKGKGQEFLLPEEMLHTLQGTKSTGQAGIHEEKMADHLVWFARTGLVVMVKIVIIDIRRAVGSSNFHG